MVEIQDWGLIEYNQAWEKQKELVKYIQQYRNKNVLVLCEHPSVITIGKSGTKNNIISKPEFLNTMGIQVVENDRGGDVTLHNPGQLVGYPIFNLSAYREDLHWFLREIEQSIIDAIAEFGIISGRVSGLTGVWVDSKRKIAAMGLHCSRWVTSHGFALNVKNNISEFDYIVPCGISNKAVTSVEKELNIDIDFNLIKECIIKQFTNHFK
jgi:lipoyl(octanoyl) transferase